MLADRARALMPDDGVLVHIALDDTRLSTLKELLSFFAPDVDVIEFPAWDCMPYDRVSPNSEIVAKRVSALCKLINWDREAKRYPRILLTTINAALQKVMPKNVLDGAQLSAAKGGRLNIEHLQKFLIGNGYNRTDTVREAGEYAIRGGIIDIFPAGYEEPLRLDLFGDEIESIRKFDPLTQRSEGKADGFSLQPVTEFFLNEESISRFRKGYLEHFGAVRGVDPLYEAVSEGRRHSGMDHWLPLFYAGMDTIFDYAPKHEVVFDHHVPHAFEERLVQVRDLFAARQTMLKAAKERAKKSKDVSLSGEVYNALPVDALYIEEGQWNAMTGGAQMLSPFADPSIDGEQKARKARDFADVRALPDADLFDELRKYVTQLGRKTIIASYSEGAATRLQGILQEHGSISRVWVSRCWGWSMALWPKIWLCYPKPIFWVTA